MRWEENRLRAHPRSWKCRHDASAIEVANGRRICLALVRRHSRHKRTSTEVFRSLSVLCSEGGGGGLACQCTLRPVVSALEGGCRLLELEIHREGPVTLGVDVIGTLTFCECTQELASTGSYILLQLQDTKIWYPTLPNGPFS